jgi:hypothetical protein
MALSLAELVNDSGLEGPEAAQNLVAKRVSASCSLS